MQPKFRASGPMVVPYYSLAALTGVKELPIVRVRIGPGPAKQLNAASVRMLLDASGFTQAEVVVSDTPYRGR